MKVNLLSYYVSASTSSILILSGPSRSIAVGDQAEYFCSPQSLNGSISSFQWLKNNMPLEDLTSTFLMWQPHPLMEEESYSSMISPWTLMKQPSSAEQTIQEQSFTPISSNY